jgi:hypothetical protein
VPTLKIDRAGNGYLAAAKRCDILCDDLTAWYAPTPAGPWRAVNENGGRVATTTGGEGLFVYGGHLLPSASGWLAVWSVNNGTKSRQKFAYGPRVTIPVDLPTPDELAAQYASPPPVPDGP